jgi:hypothetical protein
MRTPVPGTGPDVPSVADEPADVFDLALLRDWAGFAFAAVRRHGFRVAITFALILGGAMVWLA